MLTTRNPNAQARLVEDALFFCSSWEIKVSFSSTSFGIS